MLSDNWASIRGFFILNIPR